MSLENSRNAFLARAAEAMLRALGGSEVRLLLPTPVTLDATAQQLGLASAPLQEATFAPVVVRSLPATQQEPLAQFELLLAASTVNAVTETQQNTSAEALLAMARGVMVEDKQLRVLRITTEYFAGAPYLFRILAAE